MATNVNKIVEHQDDEATRTLASNVATTIVLPKRTPTIGNSSITSLQSIPHFCPIFQILIVVIALELVVVAFQLIKRCCVGCKSPPKRKTMKKNNESK